MVTLENDLHFPDPLTFCSELEMDRKKDLHWIKEVEGTGWLLFSECLPLLTYPASPRSSLGLLDATHTLARCELRA